MARLAHNAIWVTAGQVCSVAVQAGYFVVLTQLLGAKEFGLYAVVIAIVSVVSQYANLGAGFVLLRYGSMDESAIPVYWGNVLLALALCGLPVVVAICLYAHINLNSASLQLVGTVSISECICFALVAAAAQAYQSRERMRSSAALNLANNLFRLITALGLLYWLHVTNALVWARSVLLCSTAVAVASYVAVTRSFGAPRFEPRLLFKRAGEGMSFSLSLSTSALYNDLDKILLGRYGLLVATGIYTAAYRVLNAATMPAYAIYSSAFPRFFRLGAEGAEQTAKLARRLLAYTSPVLLLGAAGLYATAPYIAKAFGKGFSETGDALRLLCLIPFIRGVQWSAGDAISGLGEQRLRLILQAVAVIINLLLNLHYIPIYSWRGAAWVTLATDGSLAVMMWAALYVLLYRKRRRTSDAGSSQGLLDELESE
ncbi:MAG: oligosaccharide flippase family protein [Alloacidobacterium sp.]